MESVNNNSSIEAQISYMVAEQRRFFRSGTTLPIKWRIEQLKHLKIAPKSFARTKIIH